MVAMRSRVLAMVDRREMGRNSLFRPGLGIGTILADLQTSGIVELAHDLLKSWRMSALKEGGALRKNAVGIPSWPGAVDFLAGRAARSSCI